MPQNSSSKKKEMDRDYQSFRRRKQCIHKAHCWKQCKTIRKIESNLFGQHNNRCYTIIKKSAATHVKCYQPSVLSETFQKFNSIDHKQEQQENTDIFSEMKLSATFSGIYHKDLQPKLVQSIVLLKA